MDPAIIPIDEDGRIALPADLLQSFGQKGIRHVAIVETWDGFRLDPVADDEAAALTAPQSAADQVNDLLRAISGEADTE